MPSLGPAYTPRFRLLRWAFLVLAACGADPQATAPGDAGATLPDQPSRPGLDLGSQRFDQAADSPVPDAAPIDLGALEITAPSGATRACEHVFQYVPPPGETPASVTVAGTFNDWAPAAEPLASQDDGTWRVALDLLGLASGSHGYKFVVNGTDWRLDEANPMRRFDDSFVNSKMLVPDCRVPELVLVARTVDGEAGSAHIVVRVDPGVDGQLDPNSPRVTHGGKTLADTWAPATGLLTVDASDLPPGKQTFRFDADGPDGPAMPLLVSMWVEPVPFDWRDAIVYFPFTDRFRDEDPAVGPVDCLPADSIANWHGGDWAGITAAIDEGYFDALGVNVLWLNAPMDNPETCVAGNHGKTYSAYHGYFPSDLFATEAHFGSMDDLRALVGTAHGRGIRVIIDLVANHVHEDAADWVEHQADGWFNTDGICKEQGWEPAETCWFETYLPDLDHRNDEVVERYSDMAIWWAREADLDGFRVDAVKHIHPHFFGTLRHKLDAQVTAHADSLFWTVGETFTGAWGGGQGYDEQLIKSFIGDDMLHGQFDFPLHWLILGAFATGDVPLWELGDAISESHGYYGASALMAAFVGNHDLPRFVSLAAGDISVTCPGGGSPPWDCPPSQPSDPLPYARLGWATTLLAALPEIPLVYYGDEIGLAGAGDPDNRRPMPWGELLEVQEDLRMVVQKVLGARAASPALRRGDVTVVHASSKQLVITRSWPGDFAVAAFNLTDQPMELDVSMQATLTLHDAVDGSSWSPQDGKLALSLPPQSARLLGAAF